MFPVNILKAQYFIVMCFFIYPYIIIKVVTKDITKPIINPIKETLPHSFAIFGFCTILTAYIISPTNGIKKQITLNPKLLS